MKRPIIFLLSSFLLISIMLAVAIYIPSNIPPSLDFSGLYYADLALVHGIPVYDIPAMETLAFDLMHIVNKNFHIPHFLYPPWYILSTFYLGLLPANSAATLWFELNLIMLFFSIWFLTDGWPKRLRLAAFPLGFLFLPVLGALFIGQFDFPVLLGISMTIYALQKENIALTTLGIVLITFKPHLGALAFLAVLIYLIVNGSNFTRNVLRSAFGVFIFLFSISFFADPNWVVRYPTLLLGISSNYGQSESATLCTNCINLPVRLSQWVFNGSLAIAAVIALILLVTLSLIFFLVRASLLKYPVLLLNSALIITLLVSPYLFNYDFILLLVPLTFFLNSNRSHERIVAIICYLLPAFALGLYERTGNISLLIAAITLGLFIFLHARSQVDVPAHASYNI